MTNSDPLLHVSHLAAGYGRLPVLFDVTLHVQPGEVVAISAGNGAGKSTLLACISGLLRPLWGGDVAFRGRSLAEVPAHQVCRLGLIHVLERRRLAPFMTVRENLLLSEASVPRADRTAWKQRLDACLRDQPIVHRRGDHKAGTLSGGEQQLVAVLRGLLAAPSLLLLDEPFQGLDLAAAEAVRGLLQGARDEGCAILLTEHRGEVIEGLADRTLRLERGEIIEEVVHDGTPS